MKTSTVVLIVLALVGGIVTAAIVQQAQFPNTATVGEGLTFYLNDVEWVNGTAIEWGTVKKGSSYFYDFNVTNTSPDNYTLSLITYPPLGWSQTWIENGTVLESTMSLSGRLILSVSPSATDGEYSWNMTVQAETL